MTELSPQAQAVKDAVIALYTDQQQIRDWGWRLDAPTVAAALRAAADQVVPDESHPEESQFWDDEAEQEWQNNRHVRLQFLAIAAELEGGER
jgi:hypothetical protein